jgi:hypothetical protein
MEKKILGIYNTLVANLQRVYFEESEKHEADESLRLFSSHIGNEA